LPKWKQDWRGEWWCGVDGHRLNVRSDGNSWIATTPIVRLGPYPTPDAAMSAVLRFYRRELRRAMAALK